MTHFDCIRFRVRSGISSSVVSRPNRFFSLFWVASATDWKSAVAFSIFSTHSTSVGMGTMRRYFGICNPPASCCVCDVKDRRELVSSVPTYRCRQLVTTGRQPPLGRRLKFVTVSFVRFDGSSCQRARRSSGRLSCRQERETWIYHRHRVRPAGITPTVLVQTDLG